MLICSTSRRDCVPPSCSATFKYSRTYCCQFRKAGPLGKRSVQRLRRPLYSGRRNSVRSETQFSAFRCIFTSFTLSCTTFMMAVATLWYKRDERAPRFASWKTQDTGGVLKLEPFLFVVARCNGTSLSATKRHQASKKMLAKC